MEWIEGKGRGREVEVIDQLNTQVSLTGARKRLWLCTNMHHPCTCVGMYGMYVQSIRDLQASCTCNHRTSTKVTGPFTIHYLTCVTGSSPREGESADDAGHAREYNSPQ